MGSMADEGGGLFCANTIAVLENGRPCAVDLYSSCRGSKECPSCTLLAQMYWL